MPTGTAFSAADLVRSQGPDAEAGAALVQTLAEHMPEALSVALMMTTNEKLTRLVDTSDSYDAAAKIVGYPIESMTVVGSTAADARVVVVHFDHRGTPLKGTFPYADLATGSSDELVTQVNAIAETAAARAHAEQRKVADAANPAIAERDREIERLREQVAQLGAPPEAGDPAKQAAAAVDAQQRAEDAAKTAREEAKRAREDAAREKDAREQAAREAEEAQAKAAQLEQQLADAQQAEGTGWPFPLDALARGADEIVELMAAHPSHVEQIKAYERASRSQPRQKVMNFDPNAGGSESGG